MAVHSMTAHKRVGSEDIKPPISLQYTISTTKKKNPFETKIRGHTHTKIGWPWFSQRRPNTWNPFISRRYYCTETSLLTPPRSNTNARALAQCSQIYVGPVLVEGTRDHAHQRIGWTSFSRHRANTWKPFKGRRYHRAETSLLCQPRADTNARLLAQCS